MRKPISKIRTSKYILPLLYIPFVLMTTCSEDAMDKETEDSVLTNEMTNEDDDKMKNPSNTDEKDIGDKDGSTCCQNALNYIFNEQDGFINVEFENTKFSDDWKLKTEGTDFSGKGYMFWDGPQHLGQPGNGNAYFKLNIVNPGIYQFLW